MAPVIEAARRRQRRRRRFLAVAAATLAAIAAAVMGFRQIGAPSPTSTSATSQPGTAVTFVTDQQPSGLITLRRVVSTSAGGASTLVTKGELDRMRRAAHVTAVVVADPKTGVIEVHTIHRNGPPTMATR